MWFFIVVGVLVLALARKSKQFQKNRDEYLAREKKTIADEIKKRDELDELKVLSKGIKLDDVKSVLAEEYI